MSLLETNLVVGATENDDFTGLNTGAAYFYDLDRNSDGIVDQFADYDLDGIADAEDQEPLTPNGTAQDSDGDGVFDDSDAFANDPAASIDTDGDGMPDAWNEVRRRLTPHRIPLWSWTMMMTMMVYIRFV